MMKNQFLFSRLIPYGAAIIIFLLLALAYCSPVIQGKVVQQSDVAMATGMQKEMKEYHDKTGDYTLWTNSMFGGMPTYHIGGAGLPKYNVFGHLGKFFRLNLPAYSVDIIFVYLICFFVLLLALGVNPWLSIVGALAFGFSSYNFIIIAVGHVNKALVIGFMPAVLGGILLIYKQRYIVGSILTIIALGVHLYFNHLQMTYYLVLALGVFFVVELIYHLKEKKIKVFLISSLIAGGAAILAVAPNVSNLIATYEYSKDTNRGPSELTSHNTENDTQGIDKEYALRWSYGKAETFTFLIPNLYGGESTQNFSEDSKVYEALIENGIDRNQARQFVKSVPTTLYWGDQPFTSGPVYLGAIICFLFVLGLFLVDPKTRIWILIATVITIFLSWGRNFMFFSDLFFDYMPLYNKFRAVSSILVIPSLLFPLVAILGLKGIMENKIAKKEMTRYLKISLAITGGFALFFFLFGKSVFSFYNPLDENLVKAGYPDWLINSVTDERIRLLKKDAFRALVYILLAAGILYAFFLKKLKFEYFVALLGLFILMDMWPVNKRFLNDDNFESKRKANQVTPSQADLQILQDKDPDFRVFNLTMNPFNEAYTSFYHKSIGGYHGAKLRRYDDLITYHLSKQNMQVINMLNTKYFIVPDKDNQPMAQYNPGALGNAWFVRNLRIVNNADEEIDALNNFSARHSAIMDKRFLESVPELAAFKFDSLEQGSISLKSYAPNHLIYDSESPVDEFAVFSEIYYNSGKGWNAYIDGNKTEHVRVNYVLRGMIVPAGKHSVEFKFEPQKFYFGLKVELLSSLLVVLTLLFLAYLWFRNNKSEPAVPEVESKKP
ncbi:MAG: hypothetical protein JXA77_00175 [Bacteroidales bacterium]|nr:hypothetical protein [Bacteroidales bacterium]MBN2821244.1 hypothetical protein [Bacteroidales bacterium]